MPAYVAFAGAFNTTAGSHNATVTTPAIGDTIIVLGGYTGGTAASGSYTDNQAGGTYTKLASSVKNASADTWELFVRDNLITTTTSHIVTQADPPGADTGGGFGALRCSGFLVGGAATLVQFKVLSNQTVSGVPTVTFDAACSSTSFIVATVFHSVNSTTTFTAPSGMTERTESGYSSPPNQHGDLHARLRLHRYGGHVGGRFGDAAVVCPDRRVHGRHGPGRTAATHAG